MSNVNKILDICIMKMKMDSLHYALLAVVVLLAVYSGASFFRVGEANYEGLTPAGKHETCLRRSGRASALQPETLTSKSQASVSKHCNNDLILRMSK